MIRIPFAKAAAVAALAFGTALLAPGLAAASTPAAGSTAFAAAAVQVDAPNGMAPQNFIWD